MITSTGQLTLRGYQQSAMRAIISTFKTEDPAKGIVAVQPTGSGKTILIAECSRLAKGRVLVLAHNQELLTQAEIKIRTHAPWLDVGVYCAGLGRKESGNKIVLATVQSIDKAISWIAKSDPFSLIMIDESHKLNPKGEGRYVRIVNECREVNPTVRLLGLTATPYRLGHGLIYEESSLFSIKCCEAHVSDLTRDGYLCPIVTKVPKSEVDTSKLKRHGDFSAAEMQAAFNAADVVRAAVDEMMILSAARHRVIVFCAGVEHAHDVCSLIRSHGCTAEVVTGETSTSERNDIYDRFGSGQLKYLVNCNVLTEGFDDQQIDCVVLLRATVSAGLYAQMAGRGLRIHESKANCLLLDFGQNVRRHGMIDSIKPPNKKGYNVKGNAPIKVCPQCLTVVHASKSLCECGHVFPRSDNAPHGTSADIEVGGKKAKNKPIKVGRVEYEDYLTSRGTRSFKIAFYDEVDRFTAVDFYPLDHSESFKICGKQWNDRFPGVEFPDSIADAIYMASRGRLRQPTFISVKKVTKNGRVYHDITKRIYHT